MNNDLISKCSAIAAAVSVLPCLSNDDAIAIGKAIDKIPAVDAVEVVRCKDCKHMTIEMGYLYCCNVWQGINGSGAEGFCSYGERREDG